MKTKKTVRRLNKARDENAFLCIECARISPFPLIGFSLGCGDGWALLHVLDVYKARADGYQAIRVKDITRIIEDKRASVIPIAERPQSQIARRAPQPDILLVDLPGLLSSAGTLFPLFHLVPEAKLRRKTYGACTGRVVKIGKRNLTLRAINEEMQWRDEPVRLPSKSVESVHFGSSYDAYLWRLLQGQERLSDNKNDTNL